MVPWGLRRSCTAAALAGVLVAAGGCFGPARLGPHPVARDTFPSTLPTKSAPPAGPVDGTSQPAADDVYRGYGNPAIDVLHYDLTVDWKPATQTLTGTATLTIRVARPVNEIELDFTDGFTVSEAVLGTAPVQPTRHDHRLVLPSASPLPAETRLTAMVKYRGTPKETPFPGVRSDVAALGAQLTGDGGVYAMQEPYGAFTWFPANDQPSDKALFDVAITAPDGWTGVSSGRFMGTSPAPGGTVTRWHGTEPISTYLIAFAVDRFTRHDVTGPHSLPMTLWVRPSDEPTMLDIASRAPAMIAWLERRFGPYAFSSAGVVVVPDRSAMETQTMVTMGWHLSGWRGESVLLHELAHQWFGDTVTPRTWRDVWLNEGFASYAELLYGVDRGHSDLDRTLRAWWEDDKINRPKYGPPVNYDPQAFAEHNVYFGPALMLHELRRTLGDDRFFAMLHDWVQLHRYSNQDRASFTAWASAYTGRDLAPIIDKWLDSTTTPALPS
jgi:aminopeptidase N